MPLYVRLGDEIEVPDVTEKTDVEAVLELRRYGFEAEITVQKYDPYHAKNIILSQIPEPYTRVKKGRKVVLTRSLGERNVIVPNLISLSVRNAELELSRNNLRKGEIFYNPSAEFPEGVIISQSYEAGMVVRGATVIDITVSEGPVSQKSIVPSLQEKTLDNATRISRDNKLKLVVIDALINNDYLPNTILIQYPQPGDTLSSGDSVLVVISKIDSIARKIP
ncbi:PASTA domain-containing protein [candidate division KSB1 bacterium]|nr:PASTA domain-containing protein [candidate division KSB1 bacterium]